MDYTARRLKVLLGKNQVIQVVDYRLLLV